MGRRNFQRELNHIQDEVMILGSMVEKALVSAVISLKKRDIERAQRLIDEDKFINQKRFDIETDILVVIATQQPIAIDLRALAAALEIVNELERIGDYAKGIARITQELAMEPHPKLLDSIIQMANKAQYMLHRALSTFAKLDVELAWTICAEDEEVDEMYGKIYHLLLSSADSKLITMDQAMSLSRVARHVERTADRVTNICEWVTFIVTGEMENKEMPRQLIRQPELEFAV